MDVAHLPSMLVKDKNQVKGLYLSWRSFIVATIYLGDSLGKTVI